MEDFGLPDFADVAPDRLEADIREKLEGHRALVEAIASSQAPATVENTLLPLELETQRLEEAVDVLHTFAASVGGDEWHAVEARLNPLIVEHEDDVYLDSRLYDRFKALAAAELGPETAWVRVRAP